MSALPLRTVIDGFRDCRLTATRDNHSTGVYHYAPVPPSHIVKLDILYICERLGRRRSAGVRSPITHDSKATGDAEADASIAAHRSAFQSSEWSAIQCPSTVSVQVSATDPSRTPSGKTQPASQALLPVGLRRANLIFVKIFDDDSRYRFASYELSTPEHSRRGRPSSPCPAVAGAKPRDDGLRVASRLPPRSRLGAVTNLARGASAVILRPLENGRRTR